jgi:RecA-family ATPase
MGHVTLLAGKGGIGKTLIAQQLGSALALGRSFVDEIARPRKVLMWAAEDDHDEIWRRQVNVAGHFGVELGAFNPNFIVESFADRDCTLMDCDLGGRLVETGLLDELQQQMADYLAEVVILDNASRLFGGKENDRHQVTRFMAALNAAARGACVAGETPAAILLLAHPGRALGAEYSGSSAWENSARSRMFLTDRPPDAAIGDDEAEPNGEMRYLARRKANYSARDLRSFTYENGVLVPQEPAGARDRPFGYLEERRDERIVLDAFRHLTNGLAQQPTDGETSPNFLPKLITQFKLNEGRQRRDLAGAMRRLMNDGKLKREPIGQYGNRNPRFGLVLGPNADA